MVKRGARGEAGWKVTGYTGACAIALACGCSAPHHPPVFEDPTAGSPGFNSSGGASGGSVEAGGSAGEAGGTTGAGDAGEAGSATGDAPTNGTADPGAAYVVAPLNARATARVIAPVTNPERYTWGISSDAIVKLLGNEFIYSEGAGTQLRIFHADLVTAPNPVGYKFPATEANDPVVVTKPCATGPHLYQTGPNSRIIYQCDESGPWYDGGVQVYAGPALINALGNDDLAFVTSEVIYGVMSLKDGVVHPIGDLTTKNSVLGGVRATANGFHIAFDEKDGNDLLEVSATGGATLLGTYPDAPEFHFFASALTKDDVLYQIGNGPQSEVKRFTIDGGVETVYTQKENDYLELNISYLITGP